MYSSSKYIYFSLRQDSNFYLPFSGTGFQFRQKKNGNPHQSSRFHLCNYPHWFNHVCCTCRFNKFKRLILHGIKNKNETLSSKIEH